jgi:hypothetical protein
VGIPGFFSYLPEKFKDFEKFTTRIMAMFGSTYVCEQLFSFVKSTKTSQRTWLTDQHLSSLIKVGTAQNFSQTNQKLSLKRGVKPQDKTLKMIE